MRYEDIGNVISEATKSKIVEAQNELVWHNETFNERMKNNAYLERLYTKLTPVEKAMLHACLSWKETECIPKTIIVKQINDPQPSQRKLALLALRQKGLLFSVSGEEEEEYFLLPDELIFTLLEQEMIDDQLTINDEEEEISPKRLLYFSIDLINRLSRNDLKLLKDGTMHQKHKQKWLNEQKKIVACDYQNEEVIDLLIQFFHDEHFLHFQRNQWYVDENTWLQTLNKNYVLYEQRYISFLIKKKINNPYVYHILKHLLTNLNENEKFDLYSLKNFLHVKHLDNVEEIMDEVFELPILLRQFDLIYERKIGKDSVYGKKIHTVQTTGNGYLQGNTDLMIPSTVPAIFLCEISMWAKIRQWDLLISFQFNKNVIGLALKERKNFDRLVQSLEALLSESNSQKIIEQLSHWIDEQKPIKKKRNITFYPIENKVLLRYLTQAWEQKEEWIEVIEKGVLIETSNEQLLEKVLETQNIKVEEQRYLPLSNIKPFKKAVKLDDCYPDLSEAFPGFENLPKQWLSLRAYDERTTVLILKQSILLGVPIVYEDNNGDQVLIEVKQIEIKQGHYYALDHCNHSFAIIKIKKIAIANPLQAIKFLK